MSRKVNLEEPETWLPVLGFENRYEVSDLGRVRDALKDRLLSFTNNKDGYPMVSLSLGPKKRKDFRVHRLVLIAFCGPPPFEGAQCRHGDGNRENARLSNLCWGTAKENHNDSVRHGTSKEKYKYLAGVSRKGPVSWRTKLTEDQIREIRRRSEGCRYDRTLAEEFGTTPNNISLIRRRKTWRNVT